MTYGEGLCVGYRHFDQKGIAPLFAFGHGLTYSTFDYADLNVSARAAVGQPVAVSLMLTNAGARAASEVVQLYVGPVAPHRPTPPKALRAFAKVAIAPGESRNVAFTVEPRAFARYDDEEDRWVIDPGAYDILIGASAVDIRLKQRITLS